MAFGEKKDGGEHGLVNRQLQFTTHNAAKLAQSKWWGCGGACPRKIWKYFSYSLSTELLNKMNNELKWRTNMELQIEIENEMIHDYEISGQRLGLKMKKWTLKNYKL